MSHCYRLTPFGLYLLSSWPPHCPLWLCHRVCSCFQILQSWSDSWGVGKAWTPQRPTLRGVPRQEEELEAAPRPKSQTGDCVCPGDSWLRQTWKEALGSQSEVLDLPPRCASWPRCSSAQLSGPLSFQLLLSNGFLLPRYGFDFNNS